MKTFSILALVFLMLYQLTENCIKHGQKREKEYNGWYALIALTILTTLYYFAGLFDSITID